MHKIRVGIIRGGPSNEYEVSLKTGANVIQSLIDERIADKYITKDILIDKSGNWFLNGLKTTPHEALTYVDVVFNALHGHFGEDGKIQHILEVHGIPFTGSGSFPSAVGINKIFSKEIFNKEKIKTPQSKIIDSIKNIGKFAKSIFHAFPLPIVVKPASSGSSIGITIVKNFFDFEKAILEAFKHSDTVLIEEFIKGKEASCGVIEGFRDHIYYALPPIEIRPHNSSFFDYSAKYEGKSDEIVPGNFSFDEKKIIEKMAIDAHKALGLSHYSRSDFIIHPKRGIFILETNSLPGLTKESLIPKALEAVGAPMPYFIDHVLQLALSEK